MTSRNNDGMSAQLIDSDEENSHGRRQTDNELDPEDTRCCVLSCCNPTSKVHRFIALIFMCLLGFGESLVHCSVCVCFIWV